MESELSSTCSEQSVPEKYEDGRKVHGLLKSYHGIAYQLQWIMLVAIHSQKQSNNSGFKFRTEVEETDAGKFDDVVWKYQDAKKDMFNFLQCKHRLNSAEKITLNELLKKFEKGQKNNPFSLQKYFISFRTNIQEREFEEECSYKDGVIENLIIATNISFEESVTSSFELIQVKNPVIKALQKKSNVYSENIECWKINKNNIQPEIKMNLEESYDLIKLAKNLGDHIRDRKPFTLPSNLKPYYKSLYRNIVDCSFNRLSDNFISGINLSKQAEYLRQAFLQEEFEKKRTALNMHKHKFIPSHAEIAKVLSELIKSSSDNIIKITRRLKVVRENIDALSGYILIEDDGIKFNYKFWIVNDSDLPNDSIKQFRYNLLQNLTEYGLIKYEDSFSSIAQKFDNYRFDIKNFKTCRKELVDETSFWENVRSYNKFQFYDNVVSSSDEEKDIPTYSVCHINNDINLFFNLLIFVTNCSKRHLNSFLEKELNKTTEFIDSEYVAYAFRSEIARALDLTEDNFISNSSGVSQFINKIKMNINHYIVSGPTIEYRIKTDSLRIDFGRQTVNKLKLQHFLLKTKKQILILNAIHVKLSAVKVLQTLKRIPEFQYHGAYIFMQIDTLLHLQEFIVEVFSNTCNLLVIELIRSSNTCDFDLQDFFKTVANILKLRKDKKIVILTNENNILVQNVKKNKQNLEWKEVFDKRNSIMNLSKPSRDRLLNGAQVLFQGEKIKLNIFLGESFRSLINNELLFKLVNDSDIHIGDTIADLEEVEKYYISRTFLRNTFVKETVFIENDTFAISNISEIELNQKLNKLKKTDNPIKIVSYDVKYLNNANETKYVLLGEKYAQQQFSSFCDKFPYKTVHWLNYDKESFIWRNTKGPLDNIRKHFCDYKIEFEKKDITFVDEIKLKKAVILSAEPGMGKSTVITKLASLLKKDEVVWTLRVNLILFSSDFTRPINLVDETFAIEFLYKAANFMFHKDNQTQLNEIIKNTFMMEGKLILKCKKFLKSFDTMEVRVFNYMFNTDKVIIFLDGFDEICSVHEKKVLKLIQILKCTRLANIFVTTRPYNIVYSLENLVGDIAYTLKPFDLTAQSDFLIFYWKSNLQLKEIDTKRAEVFIDELLCEFSQATCDPERDFVSIPLQLRMLADSFQITFYEFYNSTVHKLNNLYKMKIKTKLDLLKLYKDFLKTKFEKIRFQEKKPGSDPTDADIDQIKKREYKKFINDHRKLAVYTLFNDDTTKKVLTENDEQQVTKYLLKNIRNANEKNGIIYRVVNGCPVFVHRTYAEYFASGYFWEKFKTSEISEFTNNYLPNIILQSLFNGKYVQTCRFFYFMARSDLLGKKKILLETNKISYLLECIIHTVKAIYDEYENGGTDRRTGTDELYHSERLGNIFEIHVPCIRLLFKVIDHYLQKNKCEKGDMKKIVERDSTINLLRMASETGCFNFTMFFLQIGHWTKDKYEKDLIRKKWYFTPLWLAAKNNHLHVVSLLKDLYNPQWVDRDKKSLKQRVFAVNEFNVLNSCLTLNILDGSPYTDLNYIARLPLNQALAAQCPVNILKIIIRKTDTNVLNEFVVDNKLPASFDIICNLLSYDDDFIEFVVSSGISFTGVLNLLLYEYSRSSLDDPVDCLRYAHHYKCSFFNESEYLKLDSLIKILLKSGVPFNTKCTIYDKLTMEYAEGIHQIHTLFYLLLNSSRPSDTLSKLFIENLPDVRFKIDCLNNKIQLMYGTNSDSLNIIPEHLWELLNKLARDKNDRCLNKLQRYIEEAEEEIEQYKTYPDSKTYNNTLIGYEEMLQYCFQFSHRTNKMTLFKSLGKLEKFLLERLLQYYTKQDYNILDAYNEISMDVQKAVKILNWLRNKGRENFHVSTDEVLEVLDLNNIQTNIKIQNLFSKIYKNKSFYFVHNVWKKLSYIREKKILETIKSMIKYKNISSQIYLLLNRLYVPYRKLISAILTKDYNEIESILNDVETAYIKSLINAQTEKYGSPLHYAVYINDIKMVDLFLSKGANPNCKLDILGIAVSDFEKKVSTSDDSNVDDSNDAHENYKCLSPLHLAVINGNLDIVQRLITHGGDNNIKNNFGETSSQIACKYLPQNEDIYQKITDILKTKTENKYDKLPACSHLAMRQGPKLNFDNTDEETISIEIDTVFPSTSSNVRKRKFKNNSK